MLRYLKSSPAFYDAFRDKAQQWLALPQEAFEAGWKKVDAMFDKEWLAMTSSFNVDTWLIQCAESIFPALKNRRSEVERLFFEVRGESDFGPHLVGQEISWASATGGKAKIVGVALTERLGMEYRFVDSSGRHFQVEKFD